MSVNDGFAPDQPLARPAGVLATWRSASRGTSRRPPGARASQRGVALVEFAIGFTIFLLVVFGIMQLALTYFAWNRISEAARDGARFLIVNAPLADLSTQSCAAATPATVDVPCASSDCAALLARLQTQAPFVQASHVEVAYRCSGAGNPAVPDENRVRAVTLRISGVPQIAVLPILDALGQDVAATLPAVTVTRTGEDLHTPAP